jgi:hypothetical protein
MVASTEIVPAHPASRVAEASRSARVLCPDKWVGLASSSSSYKTTSVTTSRKTPYVHQAEEVVMKRDIVGN